MVSTQPTPIVRPDSSNGATQAPLTAERDFDEDQAIVAGLLETLQRPDVSTEDEASAFDQLLRQRGYGVRQLARLIHKDPSYVSRRVRVYEDPELGDAVRGGRMPVSTAERILSVKSAEARALIQRRALDSDLAADRPTPLRAEPLLQATLPIPVEADISPAKRAIVALETLLASTERPSAEERRRLKDLSDDLLNYVYRFGPLAWV
jgi:hypothetical protein